MADAIHRYEVPVDGQWHEVPLTGAILHTAARRPDMVEVWAYHSAGPELRRVLQVFGTGQPLPPYPIRHIGTALAADGQLVWHLMERV